MPPRKYPEAEDRNEAAVSNPDADLIDSDPEIRRVDTITPDTNANQKPREPGAEGGGAQNEPVEG
ncbi:hypothetical protein IHQ71_23645 [Rhizobium sp. TH2]|uniref:hypothetical protein n=1 Tax=Rhizobium sp. TH2 TaxID=2775403 RepID=UPI002157F976|nr:hypothetical protein [Rhizobium sp. TH2]UVC08119.1 hypothetical protein IHQ71_23645 [Rhizobium sp. TH2]